MSTLYRPEPVEPEPTPTAPVDAHADDRAGAINASLLRRIPDAAFIVIYGAVIVALVAAGFVVVDKASSVETQSEDVGKPVRPSNPPPGGVDDIEESVRQYLIADPAAMRTTSGVTMTGTVTELAELNREELAGHLSRLLEQNCIDNMMLRTEDNLRISFWNYCYTSPGPQAIKDYLDIALDGTTDVLNFKFYPGNSFEHEAVLTWYANSVDKGQEIQRSWANITPVGSTDKLILNVYDPEELHAKEKFGSRLDRDDRDYSSPLNYADHQLRNSH